MGDTCKDCGTELTRANSTSMGHYPGECRDTLKEQLRVSRRDETSMRESYSPTLDKLIEATKRIEELERLYRSATSLAYRCAAELVENCFPISDAPSRLRRIAEDWKRTDT